MILFVWLFLVSAAPSFAVPITDLATEVQAASGVETRISSLKTKLSSKVIVLFGLPGVGKGTQAQSMVKDLGIPHLSMGDLIRAYLKNAADSDPLANSIQEYKRKNELVPGALVNQVLELELQKHKPDMGFILDGYPRTLEQISDVNSVLKKFNRQIDAVIYIKLGRDKIIPRLKGRRVCAGCQTSYHLQLYSAQDCLKCGQSLVQRIEDRDENIHKRLDDFEKELPAVVDFFEKENLLYTVDGDGSSKQVQTHVFEKMEEFARKI